MSDHLKRPSTLDAALSFLLAAGDAAIQEQQADGPIWREFGDWAAGSGLRRDHDTWAVFLEQRERAPGRDEVSRVEALLVRGEE